MLASIGTNKAQPPNALITPEYEASFVTQCIKFGEKLAASVFTK
jgi:hypothetical protein